MTPILSICIPIYNCGDFIGEALDSILPQAGELTEVIVYDGGSTDETQTIITNFLKKWPRLSYFRGESRGGIDADMAKCADFATGKYIWLFSGDDVMRSNAVQRAFEHIKTGNDVYICTHTICSKQMEFIRRHPVLSSDRCISVEFSNTTSRLEWFRRARTTEAFFSFMSSLIVRREKWLSGKLLEEFDGSCWGHVARLFDLSKNGLRVCYVAETWLDQRGDNDSFSDKGLVNRYRIAIEGYNKLADRFFGHNSMEAFYIRQVIRNEFRLRTFLRAKHMCKNDPQRESLNLLNKLLAQAYCDHPVRDRVMQIIYNLNIWESAEILSIYRFMLRHYRALKRIGHE